ncbi:hypothetical protein E5288_WYG005915 [Bos mutus]|uniref:Uncharacterized protein n=1 Tax=Bos mutus TaxID=72004 RepID=A0A6B0QVV4_9CETA|nr:hypothetical protein [Bos mutus]
MGVMKKDLGKDSERNFRNLFLCPYKRLGQCSPSAPVGHGRGPTFLLPGGISSPIEEEMGVLYLSLWGAKLIRFHFSDVPKPRMEDSTSSNEDHRPTGGAVMLESWGCDPPQDMDSR